MMSPCKVCGLPGLHFNESACLSSVLGRVAELEGAIDCAVTAAVDLGLDEQDFVARLAGFVRHRGPSKTGCVVRSEEMRDAYNAGYCLLGTIGCIEPHVGACVLLPVGWWCSRTKGHEGPCAARRVPSTNGGEDGWG